MREQSTSSVRERVLVRGAGGAPGVLWAIGPQGSKVLVQNEAGSASLPWRWEDTFYFDAGLYGRLAAAMKAGNESGLGSLWELATPYVPSGPA